MFGRNEEDLKRDYLIVAGEDPDVVAEVQATPETAKNIICDEITTNSMLKPYNRFQIFELVEYINVVRGDYATIDLASLKCCLSSSAENEKVYAGPRVWIDDWTTTTIGGA